MNSKQRRRMARRLNRIPGLAGIDIARDSDYSAAVVITELEKDKVRAWFESQIAKGIIHFPPHFINPTAKIHVMMGRYDEGLSIYDEFMIGNSNE